MSSLPVPNLFRTLVALVCLLIGGTVLTAQPALEAPLAEDVFPQLKPILEKAMKQSSQMLLSNIAIAQAEAAKTMANSALLPNLSGSVYYSTNTTSVSTNKSISSQADGLYYSFSASQQLFAWGTIKAQADSAAIGVKIAEKNYAEAYRLLALNIRAQYTGLVLKKIGLRNATAALKTATSDLAREEDKLRSGAISSGDIISPRLAVDDATLARDRTEEALNAGLRYFVALTGEPLDAAEIPDDIDLKGQYYGTPYAAPLLTRYISTGIDDAIQAQIYRDSIAQADLNYKIAKFRLYPKLSISASYSQANTTSASLNYVQQVGLVSTSVNLMASWSIFDGFATRGAKLSALSTKRTYEQILENYLRNAGDQAKGMERQLNFASRAMQLADTRRALQKDAVRIELGNMEKGEGTQHKVDVANSAYYQSDLNAAAARADFLARWAEFLSALNIDPAMQKLPARYLTHAK